MNKIIARPRSWRTKRGRYRQRTHERQSCSRWGRRGWWTTHPFSWNGIGQNCSTLARIWFRISLNKYQLEINPSLPSVTLPNNKFELKRTRIENFFDQEALGICPVYESVFHFGLEKFESFHSTAFHLELKEFRSPANWKNSLIEGFSRRIGERNFSTRDSAILARIKNLNRRKSRWALTNFQEFVCNNATPRQTPRKLLEQYFLIAITSNNRYKKKFQSLCEKTRM